MTVETFCYIWQIMFHLSSLWHSPTRVFPPRYRSASQCHELNHADHEIVPQRVAVNLLFGKLHRKLNSGRVKYYTMFWRNRCSFGLFRSSSENKSAEGSSDRAHWNIPARTDPAGLLTHGRRRHRSVDGSRQDGENARFGYYENLVWLLANWCSVCAHILQWQ